MLVHSAVAYLDAIKCVTSHGGDVIMMDDRDIFY
jgi:hypothetical protein